MIERDVMLLPQPDSPTNATVSCGRIDNERSETARKFSSSFLNVILRFFTSISLLVSAIIFMPLLKGYDLLKNKSTRRRLLEKRID